MAARLKGVENDADQQGINLGAVPICGSKETFRYDISDSQRHLS